MELVINQEMKKCCDSSGWGPLAGCRELDNVSSLSETGEKFLGLLKSQEGLLFTELGPGNINVRKNG